MFYKRLRYVVSKVSKTLFVTFLGMLQTTFMVCYKQRFRKRL